MLHAGLGPGSIPSQIILTKLVPYNFSIDGRCMQVHDVQCVHTVMYSESRGTNGHSHG